MNLYLVQHGEAKPKQEDLARPLSDRGAEMVRRSAEWSSHANLRVDQIRHSGKKRAEQTAELFAEYLTPADGLVAVSGIGPNDDVYPVAQTLESEVKNIMLVGHLPFLGRLAGQLITGNSDQPILRFRNAGVVCFAREDDKWLIQWAVVPDLLS